MLFPDLGRPPSWGNVPGTAYSHRVAGSHGSKGKEEQTPTKGTGPLGIQPRGRGPREVTPFSDLEFLGQNDKCKGRQRYYPLTDLL